MASLLIVDDDLDVASLVADVFRGLGHNVRTARNGQDGLAELNRALPDIVLLDVEMPLLDGPGMAYRMLVHNCGMEVVPIVLLSGVVDLARTAAKVGTPYFLAKPYSIDEVVKLCNRALSERRPPHDAA